MPYSARRLFGGTVPLLGGVMKQYAVRHKLTGEYLLAIYYDGKISFAFGTDDDNIAVFDDKSDAEYRAALYDGEVVCITDEIFYH